MHMDTAHHLSTTGPWRLARGLVVGASASGLGASAHALGGGGLPPIGLCVTLALLVSAATVAASRWQWRFAGLLSVLVGAQGGFHLAFRAMDGHAQPSMSATMPMPMATPAMLVLHLSAAVVLAALLGFGEEVLRRTIDVLTFRLVRAGMCADTPVADRLGVGSETVRVCTDPARLSLSRAPPQ